MSLGLVAIISTVLLFVLFTIGFEIGFSMALIGFLGFAYMTNFPAALDVVALDIYSVFANYTFTVIPLFILMGQIAGNAGIARRLYDTSYKFVGHIPGGLALSTIVGAVLFKAICGSTPATAATFSVVAIPEMDRYGYEKKLSCGTVAAVGTLGVLIPPCIALIIYGIIASQSIARLFLAGVFPGLLVALSFCVTIIGWCKKNPKIGPKGEKFRWDERLRSLPEILPAIVIFIIVVGGLMQGYFTPTEAGSIGTFAVLLLSLCKRDIGLKGFFKSVLDSISTACMVLVLLAGATILGHFFTATNIPFVVAEWMSGLPFPKELVMLIILLFYLLGGSFIEDIAFVILVTPIFLPIVTKLGYDLIWFGIMIMVITMIGMIIPPVAICVFIVSSLTGVPQNTVYKGIYPYLIGMTICAALLLFFPQIALWLPDFLIK